MVDLQTVLPPPALRRYVRMYTQRRLSPGANLHEPIMARLGGLLEFHFANLYRVPIFGTERFDHCARIAVVGPISFRRVQLEADGAIDALTVIFQPHGLYELFGVPTHMVAEHAEEGHALLGGKMTELYDTLCMADSFAERVSVLDAFLMRYAARERGLGSVDWTRALAWCAGAPETVSVRAMAEKLNTSVRQLERKALEYGGMSPQTMRRVARFTRALRMKAGARAMTWTAVAHSAGYYDQMHMIRDFRSLGGAAPTALIRQMQTHHGAALMLRGDRIARDDAAKRSAMCLPDI